MNIDSFIFPSSPTRTFRSLLTLRGKDQEECHYQSLLSNPFTAVEMTALGGVNGTVCNEQQYIQSLQSYDSRNLDFVFDTRGCYRLSCEHLNYLSPTLNSFNVQLAAEASTLSCIFVIIIFIWIGVCPTSIHVFILFDEVLHSGTYIGIGRRSRTVIGGCFRGLLIYTWCA